VCVERKVAIASGAFTPTEIATAWDAGANIVKVFPARVLGPGYIRGYRCQQRRRVSTRGCDRRRGRWTTLPCQLGGKKGLGYDPAIGQTDCRSVCMKTQSARLASQE
jgi:hypothetical protein